jgi:hypothetical protein
MWLCTQLGFFSIVRKEPDTFHIRARCREDLEQLAKATGTGTPIPRMQAPITPGASFALRWNCHAL